MKYAIASYKKLKDHDDWRWDGEFICFEPYYNKHYTYAKIGDILISSQYGISIDMNEECNGYKIYRMNEISNMFCDRDISKYADVSIEQANKFILNNNDVLFNRTNSQDFVGRTGIFKKYSDEQILFASYLIRVRSDERKVLPEYLTLFLNTKYGVQDIKRRARISINQSNVNAEELKRIAIPLFSIKFQRILRNIFNNSFNLTCKSDFAYSQAEQLLLSELNLLNWKPKHRLSFVKNYSDTVSSSRIDAEYFQPIYDELINKITSNSFSTLDKSVAIKKCIEPGSNVYQDNGITFLRVSNLSKFGFKDGNQQYISTDFYAQVKQHQPKKGEILLTKDASPGVAYYLKDEPEKMIPSGGILRLKVKDESRLLPEYLTLVLNSIIVQKQIDRDIGGSVINHWLVDQVKNTLIPVLSIDKQRNISTLINDSFTKREISKKLLEIAKRGVEIAIEQDESTAENWINSEIEKLGIYIDQ